MNCASPTVATFEILYSKCMYVRKLLLASKTGVSGTIRQAFFKTFRYKKVVKGKMIAIQREKNWLIMRQDEKLVCLMSTIHINEKITLVLKSLRNKPVQLNVIVDYNVNL